ncbi:MAG: glycosyltransferase, partial [Treponema sp.]|nr:glycosyltransferase [Treponema sp.]
MTFSILQSVYRRDNPDFLSQSLQSIADNTLLPSQVVLVKDGLLTPELDSVIAEWQSKLPLKVVGYEQNQGLAHALNYGLQFVETDLVARMDSDDIAYSNRFEKQICFMAAHPDIALCSGYISEFNSYEMIP